MKFAGSFLLCHQYSLRPLSKAVGRQIQGDAQAGAWVMRWAAVAGLKH